MKIYELFKAIITAIVLIFIAAITSGTIMWYFWEEVLYLIPIAPATMEWWMAVKLSWVSAALFKGVSTVKSS